jgi:hypothetical protein
MGKKMQNAEVRMQNGGSGEGEGRRLARVFPRRVPAGTPTDELAFVGRPPLWAEADEVHVSVAFSWDLAEAERLARDWGHVTRNVRIGGPGTGERSGEFVPGRYLKDGYTITSRGCPNNCWFCDAWKREGHEVRELPVRDGWDVLDSNLLACSEGHVRKVFAMLERVKRERRKRVLFTGGLEAYRLRRWHVEGLRRLRPQRMFFAYDTPDDYAPLVAAGRMLREAGWTVRSRTACCYVLIGFPWDTFARAEERLVDTVRAGFWPMAMLYRDRKGTEPDPAWVTFRVPWTRAAKVQRKLAELGVL